METGRCGCRGIWTITSFPCWPLHQPIRHSFKPLEHAETRGIPPFQLNSLRIPFMNWRHRVQHLPRSTIWHSMRRSQSVANAHCLISKCSFVGILSLDLSNMVVNVMTKDHTIDSHTHCTAAIWMTRISEGRMSTSICFRTSNHGRAGSWRVCYCPTVNGLDRSKIAETAPGEAIRD
jgi:hypothetical protein